ncbi:peptidase S9 family protein [Salinibacter sp. 10B]|uniref:S9 family peptidase n=1 Tax=Salinibacter sp. 10B TaxID=1923971 RepID=UPI000CF363EE|nr:S9 family peptidase [Salinibacter sp. 10B]PQJ33600.1 peptidase S9 family protein [Salinibacter sp. 10B]
MRTARRLLVGLFVLLGVLGPHAASAQYAQDSLNFDLEHVFDLEYATDPQLSSDGNHVVYARTFMDKRADRRSTRLWMVGTDGTGHRPITDPDTRASQPRWSPSGDRVAYVAATEDGAEIYVRWMDSGQTARLTQLEQSPGGLSWGPDGERLAFTMFVEAQDKPFAKMPSPPEGADWAERPDVVTQTYYRSDGGGYTEKGYTQVFTLPASGGTPRQITSAPYDHGGTPKWTPDGETLLLSANRHEDWRLDPLNTEVYAIDVESGSVTPLTSRQGPDGDVAVSPDGEQVAYTGFDDREQGYQVTKLYVMDRDGSDSRLLTEGFGRDVQNPTFTADGNSIVFQYDDEGSTKIGRVTMDGERSVVATNVGGTSIGRPYTSGSFSMASNGRVAYTHATPQRPADVAVAQPGQEPRVLTSLNDDLFGQIKTGRVEEFTYESSYDGKTIEGWIVKPPNFDASKDYPLILEIHGGPFAAYGPYFSAEVQLYAAAGYVVLYTNPRGSTSYGQSFGNAIHHDYPGHDYDDLMSGVDAVLERGYVDADRLFVTGGSGGGVLTSWIVGHTDRFRAAVAAKPVINWYSWVLTADMYPYGAKYWFPGMPWNHRDHYMDRSPLTYVDEVSTPTMLMTGTEDYRTPMSEAEQFYQALKLREVKTALVRVPGASHGIAARPSHLAAKAAHVLEWFQRHGGTSPNEE